MGFATDPYSVADLVAILPTVSLVVLPGLGIWRPPSRSCKSSGYSGP
ncbi:MAG: hypothetical protein MAG715_00557 [Methanonatronarchaeales archaeon]|nr:hypothetical protein [Methanonatronarchaeales archaeon]